MDTFTNGANGVVKGLYFEDAREVIGGKIISFGGLSHLINYGKITERITISTSILNNVTIHNYGNMGNILYSGYRNSASTMYVYNEGTMGGINQNSASTNTTVIINNVGVMGIIGADRIIIDKYILTINQPHGKQFNAISWYDGFNCGNDCIDDKESFYSHLLIKSHETTTIGGKDANSKIILDFGERFELGEKYLLDKIILDTTTARKYNVPLSFLALKNPDIYEIRQEGEYFIVNLKGAGGGAGGGSSNGKKITLNTPITATHKANIKAMNSMLLSSNALIFRNKHRAMRLRKRANRLLGNNNNANKTLIALDSLESNEFFFYDEPLILADSTKNAKRRAKTQAKKQNVQSNTQNINQANLNAENTNNEKYYFVFTPFVNHNIFSQAGNYKLSGVDGGFITAFSGKLNENNTLGTHFALSGGTLSDNNDKQFSIKNTNLMLGINYKLDLIWDMYLKARGDIFYFANVVSSSSVANTKSNNFGFGLSAVYGKDFDFNEWGVLGVEGGFDYKLLSINSIGVKSAIDGSNIQNYDKAVYNLLYLDVGVNYGKYFSTSVGMWGLDAGFGIRGNLTPKISGGKLVVSNHNIDFALDNDKVLAYLNVGGSYVLEMKDFDMEFSLAYNGNYGNRSVSNGGSFEWRVSW